MGRQPLPRPYPPEPPGSEDRYRLKLQRAPGALASRGTPGAIGRLARLAAFLLSLPLLTYTWVALNLRVGEPVRETVLGLTITMVLGAIVAGMLQLSRGAISGVAQLGALLLGLPALFFTAAVLYHAQAGNFTDATTPLLKGLVLWMLVAGMLQRSPGALGRAIRFVTLVLCVPAFLYTVWLGVALVWWTLVAGLVVVRPEGSEDREEARDEVKATTPVDQPTSATTPAGRTTNSGIGRYVRQLVALLAALLALFFTAVGLLALVLDGCEMWGHFGGSIGSCEPRSFPSRIPIALPWIALAVMLWTGSVALIRAQGPRDVDYGWRPDPSGRYEKRYYGPTGWTDHVANIAERLQTRDPITVDPKTGKPPSALQPDSRPDPSGRDEQRDDGRMGWTGWRSDPTGRYDLRYFGRMGWTDHVVNIAEKLQTRDPVPVDPKTGKTPSAL